MVQNTTLPAVKEEVNKKVAVPSVDINAPIKALIEESTDYVGGVTPKNKLLYILGIISFMGIVLLASGVGFYYLTQFRQRQENKEVTVVEEKVEVVEEMGKEELDRSSITFEVLNGSGTPGVAKKSADSLQALGYKIIGTGNAGDVTGNKLYLKTSAEGYSGNIITDLAEFKISTVSGELTEGTASARLVIGK